MSTTLPPLAITCDIIDRLRSCNLDRANGPFQHLVASRVLATGKHVDDLTVGEVHTLIERASVDFDGRALS